MKFRRKPEIVDAVQYVPDQGMEEGFTHYADSIRPYLTIGLSRQYIMPGDYILTHANGSLSIVNSEEMNNNWEKDE